MKMKKKLTKDDVERLAIVAWENTGEKVREGDRFAETGEPVPLSKWENVTAKEVYRKVASAVAVALGFEIES